MKPLVLTPKQAYELKWFCENVVGVRQEFYKLSNAITKFDMKVGRLEKTCEAVEKYFGEKLQSPFADAEWDK